MRAPKSGCHVIIKRLAIFRYFAFIFPWGHLFNYSIKTAGRGIILTVENYNYIECLTVSFITSGQCVERLTSNDELLEARSLMVPLDTRY